MKFLVTCLALGIACAAGAQNAPVLDWTEEPFGDCVQLIDYAPAQEVLEEFYNYRYNQKP